MTARSHFGWKRRQVRYLKYYRLPCFCPCRGHYRGSPGRTFIGLPGSFVLSSDVLAAARPGVEIMGIGMRELIVILLVVLVVFGTKKLTTIGSDLGNAVRGFKKAMSDGEN